MEGALMTLRSQLVGAMPDLQADAFSKP